MTVTDTAPTDFSINDVNQPLLTTDTYAVTLALVGTDPVNGGYTVGKALGAVTGKTIASVGHGLYMNVANNLWPSGFDNAICAAVFLKINAAKYQLAAFTFIDNQYDYNHMIIAKPLRCSSLLGYFSSNGRYGRSNPR